jgi:hypothetical protein
MATGRSDRDAPVEDAFEAKEGCGTLSFQRHTIPSICSKLNLLIIKTVFLPAIFSIYSRVFECDNSPAVLSNLLIIPWPIMWQTASGMNRVFNPVDNACFCLQETRYAVSIKWLSPSVDMKGRPYFPSIQLAHHEWQDMGG